ncbi:trypsin-like peptidase domain-containing protein [Bifidobacterium favimelis]|uniref:Trypsin-like peptidase domain-containing protein n=1 Tax=Bifidobacterium favimelis TaxID=3122979 RepID=A0ABU8ZRP5_9BIFI
MAEENKTNPWDVQGGDQPAQPAPAESGAAGAQTPWADGQAGPEAQSGAGESPTQGYNPSPDRSDETDGGDRPTTQLDPMTTQSPAPEPQTGQPTQEGQPVRADGPAQPSQTGDGQEQGTSTQSYYRPAPLYGAYAPEGTNRQGADGTQPADGGQPSTGGNQGSAGSGQGGQGSTGQYGGQAGNYGGYGAYNGYGSYNGYSQPYGNQGNPGNGYPPQGQTPGGYNPVASGNPAGGQGPLPPYGGPFGGSGQGQQGHQGHNGGNVVTAVISAFVAGILVLILGWAAIANGWVTVPGSSNLGGVSSNNAGQGTAKVEGGQAPDWQAISKNVSASVVSIQTELNNAVGAGSGAVIDTAGHIVTNNHVVSGANKIQVTLSNGQMYSAQVLGTDTTADLAVIKLDNPPSDLKPVEFADSDKLAVGENVMAIGNPLGYENTATTGIVSALNRPVTVMDETNSTPVVTNAVQLDAAINPGNSGGPTFNVAGKVIGINSSIASTANSHSEAGSIGIGFAIPSNLVKRVADEIIKDGKAKHVALGITIQSGTAQADGVTRGGARVMTVNRGTPAEKAGIKANDTIVAFNGNAVNNNFSLLGYVRAASLGSQAKVTVVRDGKTMDLNVTLDKEEEAVNGTPRKDPNSNKRNQQNQNQNQDQNGDGSQGKGNGSDGDNGDDDFFNPFGFGDE